MARYCPNCGRNIPYDAKLCPYCEKTLATNEGIISGQNQYETPKKDNIVLIIAIVIIVLIIVSIAIAATVYVYVSGMTGPSSMNITPDVNMQAEVYESNDKNATITIDSITGDTVYWYSFSFNIYDITDKESLVQYTDYTISQSNYGKINQGDKIEIIGKSNELEPGNSYRLSINYYLNDQTIETVTWTQ